MNPSKVERSRVLRLTDLPNIGKAGAADLELLGIQAPEQLMGRCPFEMYAALCEITGQLHDPCVIDVFISVTRFVSGEAAKPWWDFTQERKHKLMQLASPASRSI
ncbi:helix-hairpin-helix domain-containing protein [Roseateles albus]|uniref:Helix-hairpin-helix domain-containing protein n=1 Tax=Roseateles albus TaxID=2987525 RepID=A0ABT5KDU6_9BURK|nr:helix-hairpin-helix domain-containing protein [Roseateles albus]MDC8772100.1 helix-hairpin-helix domain-containing protein [Roseateles albus]